MAFTITITLPPKAKQPIGLALFALSATFAPAIEPTIGGYLTENLGWQYIFHVNVVPGALMLVMLWISLDPAPMKLELLCQGVWPGIATMAIGLASLQAAPEDGDTDDWFGSPYIVYLSVIAAISLRLFIAIELKVRQQANIMAFRDTFYLLGAALTALVASPMLKGPNNSNLAAPTKPQSNRPPPR